MAPLSSDSNEDRIDRVLAGDRDAFRELVRDHNLSLRAFLGSQLYHQDEVDDLAQEVFITALQKLDTFDRSREFGAWLRGIARHKLYNHFRSIRRRSAAMQRFQAEVQEIVDPEIEAATVAETQESIQALLRCIDKLPDRMKQVVRAGLAGQKADQLADELSTSRGAVFNLHYRANTLLRTCVSESLPVAP